MGKGMLFFNGGIGDTILASGLVRKFSNRFDKEIFLATENSSINEFGHKTLGVPTYSSNTVHDVVYMGKGMDTPIEKHFNLGHMFYSYTRHSNPIDTLLHNTLDELEQFGIGTLFIMHYSFIYASLGRMARERGFQVHGYFLDEIDRVMQTNRHHEPIPAVIWDNQYIGDRLSRLVTGLPLNRQEDFTTSLVTPFRDKVTLFPTTKSPAPNAGNWHMDLEMLKYIGYRIEAVYHHTEKLPDEMRYENHTGPDILCYVLGDKIEDMLWQIERSEFIICYDSASFHFAWLTDTPAIVKLKGGFNEEWIPTWVKDDPKYFFIPATPMHEEEYLTYLRAGLKQLRF